MQRHLQNSLLSAGSPFFLRAVGACFAITFGSLATGCQAPSLLGNNPDYHSTRSRGEIEEDRAYVENMENKARRHRNEDNMADAEATEVATRNNPTSVSTSQTNIVPFFW